MMMLMNGFLNDESGATAIEYAMIAAFIAVAIVGAVTALGTSLTGIFGNVNTDL
jgi:pilus assembly protein Flp/PilA